MKYRGRNDGGEGGVEKGVIMTRQMIDNNGAVKTSCFEITQRGINTKY